MKKIIIIYISLILSVGYISGQDVPAIVFETTETSVDLTISASGASAENEALVWIDLNGNEKRDSGEGVTSFKTKVTYPIETNTVRVYGPIDLFNCESNSITSLDVSGASNSLGTLYCRGNELTSLDFSSNARLKYVSCYSNKLTSIIPHANINALNMYSNRLDEDAMSVLVNSLGDMTVSESPSKLTLYYSLTSPNSPNQNIFTLTHANTIASKNWEVRTAGGDLFEGPYHESKYKPSIIFATTNDSVLLAIRPSSSSNDPVWIDLNGNNNMDDGEEITTFSANDLITYPIKTTFVSIYGPVWTLDCRANNITSLDMSGGKDYLGSLNCSNNRLTSLDLSTGLKLGIVDCSMNSLTSIITHKWLNHFTIFENSMSVPTMTALVNSLSDRTGQSKAGTLVLYNDLSKPRMTTDNIFLESHANSIAPKNWIAYDVAGETFTGPYVDFTSVETTLFNEDLHIYPESNGIRIKNTKPTPLEIYSVTGQLLYSNKEIVGDNFIPFDHKGVYIINNRKFTF